MSFLGPKPNQDPMNTVFEQKKFLGEKFFGPPGPPDRKKIGPGPAGPPGGPKVVQIVPLGSLTLLKRSGTLKNNGVDYKFYGVGFWQWQCSGSGSGSENEKWQ